MLALRAGLAHGQHQVLEASLREAQPEDLVVAELDEAVVDLLLGVLAGELRVQLVRLLPGAAPTSRGNGFTCTPSATSLHSALGLRASYLACVSTCASLQASSKICWYSLGSASQAFGLTYMVIWPQGSHIGTAAMLDREGACRSCTTRPSRHGEREAWAALQDLGSPAHCCLLS